MGVGHDLAEGRRINLQREFERGFHGYLETSFMTSSLR